MTSDRGPDEGPRVYDFSYEIVPTDDQITPEIRVGPTITQGRLLDEGARPSIENQPYDPSEDRENVRKVIIYVLLGILAGVILIISAFLALDYWDGSGNLDEGLLRDLMTPIIASLFSLIAAAVGFYYGSDK